MIVTALKIIGAGAAVGFGTVAVAHVVRTPSRRPALAPAPEPGACALEAWASLRPLDHQVAADLPLPALLTLEQFPGFHLTTQAQAEALEALEEYFAAVEETEQEEGTMIEFPGVEGSSIPEDGMTVGVARALDRVENYRRFGAAAVASVLARDCEWPEPFSAELPDDPKAVGVWNSLEHLAVVALAARDEQRVRVDVDPAVTVLDDRLEACVPEDLVLPIRSPTTLAPELGGDPEDVSWQISHDGQVQAFALLREHLADPAVTAPVAMTVAAVAPRCPWGDKRRYGLRMTTLWYDVRRLERVADQPGEEETA